MKQSDSSLKKKSNLAENAWQAYFFLTLRGLHVYSMKTL